jgi:SPP1 gp7 family putative phage head morphogenesis protein
VVLLTANVPEHVRRAKRRGRRANPRAVGPTLAAEVSMRLAINRVVEAVMSVAREQAGDIASGIRSEMTTDTVALLPFLARALRAAGDAALGELRSSVRRIFSDEEARHRRDFASTVRASAGPDLTVLFAPTDVLSEVQFAIERSVGLISGIADDLRVKVVNAVMDAGSEGTRSVNLATTLTSISGWGKKRAKLIARDQLAEFNGNLNRVRQQQAGFDKYIWRTSMDERVRPTHAARESKIFSWASPPTGGHPGEDYNCRCVAQAYLGD